MPDQGFDWRFFSPEAIDRIVEAGGGWPDASENDPRSALERRLELNAALEFAADRFVTLVAAQRVRRPTTRGRGRAVADVQSFAEDLLGIWLDVFEGRFRTSVDVLGEATGPLVRFLEACFDELLVRFRPGGLLIVSGGKTQPAAQAKLVQALRASRTALRQRVRRSGWQRSVKALAEVISEAPEGTDRD